MSTENKKDLIIVESPNKVKTISKILGNKYNVMSSVGHILRIADKGYKNLGIDVNEGTFEISYSRLKDKADVVRNLKLSMQEADTVYLASDLDREGELIADNLRHTLKIPRDKYQRITFNEITEKAVMEAIENPRDIDHNLVAAAETRSIEDKIIGYMLSGIANKHVGAKSVGRVQSSSLIIICEREEEINNFVPKKYYEIYIQFIKEGKPYLAKYIGTTDKKNRELPDLEIVKEIIDKCKLNNEYLVNKIDTTTKRMAPPKPLITTTMQTEASSKLGFSPAQTMRLAQQLFEGSVYDGVDHGLITYIRTDKAEYSEEFGEQAKAYIIDKFGGKYLNVNTVKKAKKKEDENAVQAQEAHEGIHPVDLNITPEDLKSRVTPDLYRLYEMIYNRSIASYMKEKELTITSVIINNSEHLFRYSYTEVAFDGFSKMYVMGKDIDDDQDEDDNNTSEKIWFKQGEALDVKDVYSIEKETQPPRRYSEAGLIKKLETSGIGRPSTYASTMNTLKDRNYIQIESRSVRPTELGVKLYEFLGKNFSNVINVEYTSIMENELDQIAKGEVDKLEVLKPFWDNIIDSISAFNLTVKDTLPEFEPVGRKCPKCGEELMYKVSYKGLRYIGCSNHPKCKHVEWLNTIDKSVKCPDCEDGWIVEKSYKDKRTKRMSKFYACSGYPNCTHIMEKDEYERIKNENEKSE